MINKIKEGIWQIEFSLFGSCVYILKHKGKIIVIDTGARWNKKELLEKLKELKMSPPQVDVVILTHNHFDHTGNVNIFKNAKIYGGKEDFKSEKIFDADDLKINGIEIIKTPGHSKGSVCIYLEKEKILFSGDTIFHHGMTGRTDLSGGSGKDMKNSLKKIEEINYKFLCPGHI
ncbi:MAG: MBL fold metallo-hydrolase [archaeon]